MAKDGQVFEFDVEADRKADEVMAGERFGIPSNPQGVTTETPDRAEQVEEAIRQAAIEDPAVTPQTPDEVSYLKRKLGEQGNEIGELRRQAAEALALRMRLDQLERQRAPQQQIDPNSIDLFGDIPADQRYMSPSESNRLNRSIVALAQAFQGQLEAVRNETAYHAVRAASGVSEAQEAEIVSQYPWVNSLSGKDRAAAIVEMVRTRKGEQAAPQKAATEAARTAARGASYIESSTRTSSMGSDALEPAHEKLLREARSGRFKSADDLRSAFRKAGIPNVDENGRKY